MSGSNDLTQAEWRLTDFVHGFDASHAPEEALAVVRNMLLTTLGTAIAGASEDGCAAILDFVRERDRSGGATVFIHGDSVSASGAALVNGVMCRALDFCDAMAPGLHVGSSLIPAALAAVELAGGCSGRDFLSALLIGAEVASRMNLAETDYDGADPTGVAGVFGATAAVARILGLDRQQTLHSLALALNRAAGSFQSNIDGSLAVRLIQGWVAETGVMCAQLAQRGITGPGRFLSGVYGYAHQFARGLRKADEFVEGLGEQWQVMSTVFKKYPSCGLTQGVTELALRARKELDIGPGNVGRIEVRLPPYAFRLVGHDFVIGENPRVNAQFSAKYCVANALVRGASRLEHFVESSIRDPEVLAFTGRVDVISDETMQALHHTAVEFHVEAADGRRLKLALDIAPGFPGNALPAQAHLARFTDCLQYAAKPVSGQQANQLVQIVNTIQEQDDAHAILSHMQVGRGGA
ncbi:MmgE/PrpD family protein [Paraburkholderia strydomiana]|nr:MmgE/PrpD family protein [Paraburkholderia strydomiana]